jgi:murein hydrolase activator
MCRHKIYLTLLTLCLLIGALPSVYGQKTKSQLQKEKQQNLLKIQETEKIISETAQQKNNSLGELSALSQRIRQQENLIRSIKNEIGFLDVDIDENNQIIEALQEDVNKLKEEYASMLFSAQKASGKADKLMFLFSSKNFDQLLMRLKYMEQYSNARKEQADAITKVQHVLGEQVRQTEIIKGSKSKLLNEGIRESDNLTGLKQKKKEIVKSLEKEEKFLRKDLDETKRAVAVLDKLINDIIREEIERAAREAKEREAKARANNKVVEAAPSVTLSSSFEENRSKFPWPVSGFISQKFGRQEHPVLKGIVLQNDGINIQTKQEEKVKCIFEGEVRAVASIPSIGTSVIISHGEYFTVYSGLKDVLVKKGQKVNLNQEIGQVHINSDGVSELRFQIRKNTVALDPQTWLKN